MRFALRTISLLCLLLAALAYPAPAQVDSGRTATALDTAAARSRPGSIGDTSAFVMAKSPVTAVLYGIIPGGGQVYTEQYWKVPLFAGAAGFFIWRTLHYHNRFIEKADEAEGFPRESSEYQLLKQQREFYRDERDINAAYVLGVEILGMIDAYVGAHMFDFYVDEGVSSRIYLNPVEPGLGFSMRW